MIKVCTSWINTLTMFGNQTNKWAGHVNVGNVHDATMYTNCKVSTPIYNKYNKLIAREQKDESLFFFFHHLNRPNRISSLQFLQIHTCGKCFRFADGTHVFYKQPFLQTFCMVVMSTVQNSNPLENFIIILRSRE